MEIVIQTIRIIEYENNVVYIRNTPDTFCDYVKQLIVYINNNTSIREYRTRSVNTEVISCVLDIIKNQIDENFVTNKIDCIAHRLQSAMGAVIYISIFIFSSSHPSNVSLEVPPSNRSPSNHFVESGHKG